ncbi:hypothetical protein [Vibrio caribbeanicus]|uniref:hypothetical protein n=1 Tax=Vibrio caribbeanicus TaxID=701175 RepID=UPI00228360A6|nr:hypothetical protein [Vibrio caribbeanicus]MCY9843050.1 hypothetical protein [Vibrio caribbeanicus]
MTKIKNQPPCFIFLFNYKQNTLYPSDFKMQDSERCHSVEFKENNASTLTKLFDDEIGTVARSQRASCLAVHASLPIFKSLPCL